MIPPLVIATGLQSLTLHCNPTYTQPKPNKTPKDWLMKSDAVQHLTVLTSLACNNIYLKPDALSKLPPSLQVLKVGVCATATVVPAPGSAQVVAFSLGHLSALRELQLAFPPGRDPIQASLPQSVTSLTMFGPGTAQLTPELRQLSVDSLHISTGGLCFLHNTPQLQELHLFGGVRDPLVNYLATDKHGRVSVILTPEIVQESFEGLAACKPLTLLGLHCCDYLVSGQDSWQFSAAVEHLQGLRTLDITSKQLDKVMLQLPLQSLSGLTSLRMDGSNQELACKSIFGNVTALANLQELSFVCCRVQPAALANAVLPVVAALTGLTRLKLLNKPALVKEQGESFVLPDLI